MINNLDRESGYISISYSGNPEDFVDCGSVQFHNATTDYNYNVASQTSPWATARQVELSGRINVRASPATGSETKVSVIVPLDCYRKVRAVELRWHVRQTNQVYQTTAAFNSGNYGAMGRYVCRPTGKNQNSKSCRCHTGNDARNRPRRLVGAVLSSPPPKMLSQRDHLHVAPAQIKRVAVLEMDVRPARCVRDQTRQYRSRF